MKIKGILSFIKTVFDSSAPYSTGFYVTYDLYVLFKDNKDIKNIKNVIREEINKRVSAELDMVIHVDKETDDLFSAIIVVSSKSALQKVNEALNNYKELVPPWTAFPDMMQGFPRWNQGHQEHYLWNYWLPYWNMMSAEERNAYAKRHKAPKDWVDYLNAYGLSIVGVSGVIKNFEIIDDKKVQECDLDIKI